MESKLYEQINERVEKLLRQYQEYQKEEKERQIKVKEQMQQATKIAVSQGFTKRMSTADVLNNGREYPEIERLGEEIKKHEQRKKEIGESMFFDDPLTWMMYKFQAYQGTKESITTLEDIRNHCKKQGYICTKRFIFINRCLKERGLPSLLEDAPWKPKDTLDTIYSRPEYQAISEDEEVLRQWRIYEYYTENGCVAKWENYESE